MRFIDAVTLRRLRVVNILIRLLYRAFGAMHFINPCKYGIARLAAAVYRHVLTSLHFVCVRNRRRWRVIGRFKHH